MRPTVTCCARSISRVQHASHCRTSNIGSWENNSPGELHELMVNQLLRREMAHILHKAGERAWHQPQHAHPAGSAIHVAGGGGDGGWWRQHGLWLMAARCFCLAL